MSKNNLLKSFKHTLSTFFNLPFLYARSSYSQEGEDMSLLKLFDGKKDGFFVDIGAHHPFRYSNTYALYRLGWWGINIDAAPGSMRAFSKTRPRDINLELAVSNKSGKSTICVFEDGALNIMSSSMAQAVIKSGQSKLIKKVKVKTRTLRSIFSEYLHNDSSVDLLNVDVEGFDLKVLKSNDWRKYKPKVIVVEDAGGLSLKEADRGDISKFLRKKGYELRSKIGDSLIFVRSDEM
jgi:FkbM family methyltransferase